MTLGAARDKTTPMPMMHLDFTPAFYFVAVPETVGATDDEVDGFENRGPTPTDRQQAIWFSLGAAANALMRAAPAGRG